MGKSGPKGPRKGPITDADIKMFEGLCSIQCTLDDIAGAFDTTRDSIIKRVEEHYGEKFSTVFKAKRANGKISLRRKQWQKAHKDNNTTMQIFLGKNYLGQSDKGIEDDEQKPPEPSADEAPADDPFASQVKP